MMICKWVGVMMMKYENTSFKRSDSCPQEMQFRIKNIMQASAETLAKQMTAL